MSDRVYREIHNHTGAAVNAGTFPQRTLRITTMPVLGDTLAIDTISGSPVVTLTFTDSTSGADWNKLRNGTNNTYVYIGRTAEDTHKNIVVAINSNDHLTQIGKDNTITATLSGVSPQPLIANVSQGSVGVTVYENAKIAGNIDFTAVGTITINKDNNTTGVAIAGAYTTDKMYNGIQKAAAGTTDVLVRTLTADGYNIGPPHNQLEVKSIRLVAGVIHPIQTFGCTDTVNVLN